VTVLTTTGKATTDAQEFIEASRLFFKEDFLAQVKYCLEQMPDSDLWWRPNEQSNSVGNLVLHLCGNMRQWIVSSIGGVPFERDRDAEFSERRPVSKAELIARIDAVVNDVDKVLESLPTAGLLQRFAVQTYKTSQLHAIYHVVEHFSYHLGQILYIYKMRTGKDPEFYKHLAAR
jgi:uncharacterized damage-inducible protein DinB